eukprot:352193-Chlamydomonas_euryale.AAC.4
MSGSDCPWIPDVGSVIIAPEEFPMWEPNVLTDSDLPHHATPPRELWGRIAALHAGNVWDRPSVTGRV